MSYSDVNILLKRKKVPLIISCRVFEEDDALQMAGLLLCKSDIKWKKYRSDSGWSQARKSAAFSHGWTCRLYGKDMKYQPINKHLDIFNPINVRIKEILRELKKNDWMHQGLKDQPDYWIGHAYLDNDSHSFQHIDSRNTEGMSAKLFSPIVHICFGGPRILKVKPPEGEPMCFELQSGVVLLISEKLLETHSLQILRKKPTFREAHDSYFLSLIGRFIQYR